MATVTDEVEKVQNLCHELQQSNWEEVESLLNSFPEVVPNVYVSARRTVLHAAAIADPPAYHLGQILGMVDIDFCSQPDKFGDTPLSLICALGHDLDAIRLLALEYPQGFQANNRSGSSPCDMLMQRYNEDDDFDGIDEHDIARIIADVAEAWPDGVLAVNIHGQTLLQRAIPFSCNDFALLRMILEIHSDLIEMTDPQRATAIHYAARADDEDAAERLKLLLERGGSRALCVQDSNGRTPLHEACHWGAPRDVVATLVANHAGALIVRDTVGMTPLETFRQYNQSFLAESDYTGPNWYEWYNNLADIAVTLLTSAPLRCSDSPSLHDLLRNPECTLDIAKLLTYALRDQTSLEDCNSNLPLHIVASMDSDNDIMYGKVVETLLELYPAACQITNSERTLPLQLMDRSGKSWSNGMMMVLLQHPAAVLDLELNRVAMCALLEKVGGEEKPDALFRLLNDAPALLQE
jgi:ankyrin repeat protein